MEKGRVVKMVYNAEPLGYSENARKAWIAKGYHYQEGSWGDIDNNSIFKDVEVLIVRLKRKVSKSELDKFPNLKILVSATTGHDHLDVNLLQKRNIKLVSLRGQDKFLQTIPSTAEHTWALIMSLVRNIPSANKHVKLGNWNRDSFRGIQLKDKTLGIVGYGRTGRSVAKFARAFGMYVRYYDPYIPDEKDEKIESLIGLFKIADILSFHVHLNKETQHLLHANNIQYVKQGAYLINTSRGKIWEEEAVAAYLKEEKIKGVATDVLATELSNIKSSMVWQQQQAGNNIIITPHIGGATWDAMWACEEFITTLV